MIPFRPLRTAGTILLIANSCTLFGAGSEPKPLSTQKPGTALSYEKCDPATPEEQADLERFVTSHGCSLQAFNLETTTDRDFAEFFGLAKEFKTFDRQAEIYGCHLFTAVFWGISYAGNAEDKDKMEAEFARHIDAQPSLIRQRVRDFLYYTAYNPDPKVMAGNELGLRTHFKLLFPESYTFGKNDPVFQGFSTAK